MPEFQAIVRRADGVLPFCFHHHCLACNKYFRMSRITEGTLSRIASNSVSFLVWRRKTNQFRGAFKWLHKHKCEHQLNKSRPVRSASPLARRQLRQIPLRRKRYSMDGYDAWTNTVYKFQGCFCHGCLTCFTHQGENHAQHLGLTIEDMYLSKMKNVGV